MHLFGLAAPQISHLICFVCQVMYLSEYLNRRILRFWRATTTRSECQKGRRGIWRRRKKKVGSAVADSTVINQASTMFKPLNTDLPQSAWVWGGVGLTNLQVQCTCAQLQPADAGMLFPTKRRLSLAVSEWKAECTLGSWAQTVRAGLMQTDRQRYRPLMSPLVLTWKRQCSPKAGFLPHMRVQREAGEVKTNGSREWEKKIK